MKDSIAFLYDNYSSEKQKFQFPEILLKHEATTSDYTT